MIDLLYKKSYFYNLPQELIAQYPTANRSCSRLLKINKNSNSIEHLVFSDIVDFFKKGDVLVLNSSRVIPARLFGYKLSGAMIEVFLLNPINSNEWTCLVKPGRKVKLDTIIKFSEELSAKVVRYAEEGARVIRFSLNGFENNEVNQRVLMDEFKKIGRYLCLHI